MKEVFFFALFQILTLITVYTQIKYSYENENLFKGKAIVFTNSYTPPIKLPAGVHLFTPTEEDILQAEHILIERYNKDLAGLLPKVKNPKKKFWRYNRQYLGYIDQDGDKFLIINLLNFKHRKKAKENFEGWEEFFFVGFGKYYEKNSIRLVANLDENKLRLL